MKIEQGKILKWQAEDNSEILWMVLEDNKNGVVIHSSKNVAKIGSIWNLSSYKNLKPFIGTVNIESKAS
jgi:hypothetical protein